MCHGKTCAIVGPIRFIYAVPLTRGKQSFRAIDNIYIFRYSLPARLLSARSLTTSRGDKAMIGVWPSHGQAVPSLFDGQTHVQHPASGPPAANRQLDHSGRDARRD